MTRFDDNLITLDTVKIKMHESEVSVNWRAFTEKHSTKHKETRIYRPDVFGIGFISYDMHQETVTIETSAKTLGNDYGRLISWNTFENYVDVLNSTDHLRVTPESILNAQVLRADFCKSRELDYLPEEAVTTLKHFDTQGKYNCSKYGTGIMVKRKAKSQKDVFVCYGKQPEMNTAKNRLFVEKYPLVLANITAKTLQSELRVTDFKSMRKHTDTEDVITLEDVLSANTDPLADQFRTFANEFTALIPPIKGTSMKQIVDDTFIEAHNCCLDSIVAIIEVTQDKKNWSNYKSKYKRLIADYKARQPRFTRHQAVIDNLLKQFAA